MKTSKIILELVVFATLVAAVVLGRLLPHAPNFTPVAAVALFSGFFFRRGWVGVIAVAGGMLLTDVFLGFYDRRIMIVVYGCLLCPVLLRYFLRGRAVGLRVITCALASSIIFFLGTNFAVWLFSGMYSHTFEGIRNCYVAALPFARFTVLGDIFWSSVLFGAYALIEQLRLVRSTRSALVATAPVHPACLV